MLWRETQKIRGDILADDMALSAETDGTLYTTTAQLLYEDFLLTQHNIYRHLSSTSVLY